MANRFNRRELDRNDREIGEGLEDLVKVFGGVEDLAADLVQENYKEEAKSLKLVYGDLLDAEGNLKALQRAAKTVFANYTSCDSVNLETRTDFEELVEQALEAELAKEKSSIEERLQTFSDQFLKSTEDRAPTNEDEDLVITQSDRILNAKCPLSMTPIDDIKEPVVDQMGYVYEKSFILQHLKKHPNSKCPVPGTTHRLKASDIKPHAKLLSERRRKERHLRHNQKAGQS